MAANTHNHNGDRKKAAPPRAKRRRWMSGTPDGYTLIEVLFALGIFTIGILAVAGMQIRAVNLNAGARMQTEATVVAADWMERLAGLAYDDDQLDENTSPHQSVDGVYRVVWSVSDDLPINQTKTIMVWVSADNPNADDVIINFIKAREP